MKIYLLLIPILIACRSQSDLEEFNDQYSAALNEAIKEKLLRDPEIVSDFGSWGAMDNFPKKGLSFCEDNLVFYINPLVRDTGRVEMDYYEDYLERAPCKIFLLHEGTVIEQKRILEKIDINMDLVLSSLVSNQNDSDSTDGRKFQLKSDNMPERGILITLSNPFRSQNSIYQVIEFSDRSFSMRVYVTLSFDRSTLQFRHYDHFFF